MSPRNQAMSVPAPAGWVPKVGDTVYVPNARRNPGQGMVCTTARVELLAPPLALVSASWGKERKKVFSIDQLRPLGGK